MLSSLTQLEQRILKILLINQGKPELTTTTAIYKQTKITRENIRLVMRRLRFLGFPICANASGYFYARTEDVLVSYLQTLDKNKKRIETEIIELTKSLTRVGTYMLGEVVGEKGATKIVFKKTLIVKLLEGGVQYREFETDDQGNAIIPPGTTLV